MNRTTILLAAILACLAAACDARAEALLTGPAKIFGDGRHNAFTDLVRWNDAYYLCFRHGAGHLSMDGEIRVMRSRDFSVWEQCAVVDTLGDDRDPHFTVLNNTLFLFFGVWDLAHAKDNGTPGRGRLRSHFATTTDGEHWSEVRGVHQPDWWLWRVRAHGGVLYSPAYFLQWPSFKEGELRLLKSADGLAWEDAGLVTKERIPDEADIRFLPDGSLEMVARTCDKAGNSMWLRRGPGRAQWEKRDLEPVIHCPVFAEWGDRCFVAGRGKDEKGYNTSLWELKDGAVKKLITLPSGGDTAYPGLITDPAADPNGPPVLLVTWYSQHERAADRPDEASIYGGRVTITP